MGQKPLSTYTQIHIGFVITMRERSREGESMWEVYGFGGKEGKKGEVL